MYRAHKLNSTVSRAFKESNYKVTETLLKREVDKHKILTRSNIVSTSRGGFSLAKFAISGFIATGATIGSALLYAGRNDKVRDDIESKIPLAKPVLSSIYGEKVKPEVFGSTNYPEYSLLNKETEKEEGDEIPKRLLPLDTPENPTIEGRQNSQEQTEPQNSELIEEDLSRSHVVVITTIDDQAAVSSVDLDISNSTSKQKMKRKGKKKTTDKIGTKSEQEARTEGNIFNESVGTLSGLQAVHVAKDAQSCTKDSPDHTFHHNAKNSPSEPVAVPEIPADEEEAELESQKANLVTPVTEKTALQESLENLEHVQDLTIKRHADAAIKLNEYAVQFEKAMATGNDSLGYDKEWKAAVDLEHESQSLIEDAQDLELKMQLTIEAVYELINGLRESGSSEIADLAQESATKASLALIKASESLKEANESLLQITEQATLTEERLNNEVFSILQNESTGVPKNGDTFEGFKVQSNNALLMYAMKKIELLKSDLENLRLEGDKKLEEFVENVIKEEERKTNSQLSAQEENLKRDFEVLLLKKEADLLNEFEGEIRKQLKRQSAAHREHLADVLEAHTEKLSADHKIHLAHELNRQKLVHGNEMTKIVSRLYGVESLMDLVDGAERKNKKTRELWLSAQSLNCVLNKEFHGGKTKNLLPEIGSIAKISENNKTVRSVLDTIPENAAVQGVSTEEGLRKRFKDVKRICKRVAMIGNSEGSLWTYIISSLRSFLVFETQAKRDIVNDIDPASLGPFEILAKSQHCIDKGDLELAVKFMSLLKGLPRKLAGDWLREAIVYLETKQAAEFLLAYAASEV